MVHSKLAKCCLGASQLFVKFMRRECEQQQQQCTTRGCLSRGAGHSFISKLCLTTPREGNKVAAFCLLASCLRFSCCRCCFFGFFLCFYILLLVFMRVINTRTHTATHSSHTQTGIKNQCILFWAVAKLLEQTHSPWQSLCADLPCVCVCD